ncbi:MAG: hypothetical protein AAFV19_21045 [Pseudomonadota bacterium]
MKEIRKITLVLNRSRERVYVAEIVDTLREAPERYLVNYRYGWSGKDLTEGTRTQNPVDLETAERLFESLILARTNQGYVEGETAQPWQDEAATGPSPVAEDVSDPRSARLLYLLERAGSMPDEATARLVWRIGQVRLAEAVPMLRELRHNAGPVTARVLAYALLRCGRGQVSEIVPALAAMRTDDDPVVTEQARIASMALGDPATVADTLRSDLPNDVRDALDAPHAAAVQRVTGYLTEAANVAHRRRPEERGETGAPQQRALVDLFLLSRVAPQTRPIVLDVLRAIPMGPFTFRAVRRIFKAAEALDDAPVFAVLAHRFEFVKGTYNSRWASERVRREQASETSRLAWSQSTRTYFRRRVWRQLRRLGALGDAAYVPMAAAVLAEVPQDPTNVRLPHASNYTVHKILHGASRRMTCGATLGWRLNYGAPLEASGREEPYAALWDAAPGAALGLLTGAASEMVRAFAARILADNPAYCATIPATAVAALLTSDSNAAYALGLRVARDRLAGAPDEVRALVPALIATGKPDAMELAQTVLSLKPELATEDAGFAADLILSVSEASYEWLDGFWSKHAAATDLPELMAEVVEQAALQDWDDERLDEDKARVRLSVRLLAGHFPGHVQAMPGELLNVLASAPAVPLKLFAILLAAERPDGIARFDPASLATNDDPDLQAAGATLLAHADPTTLAGREELVLAFLTSGNDAARDAAVTAAGNLAATDPAAADRLAAGLLPILYRREQEPGTRDAAVAAARMPAIMASFVRQGPNQIWRMLRAKAEPARRIGSLAVQSMPHDAYTLRKTARIGVNDQVVARRWAVAAIDARLGEIADRPEEIFALLDGDWPDSREAAYDLIRTRLDVATWRPETVVALCDCVTKPAQAFGREMLGRAFSDTNADLFLRRLSEHPSPGFRLTIARLIREYAGGDAGRLADVSPALRTILSRVFSSRAAKEQAFSFMAEEIARADASGLATLGDLLEILSATCAVGDKTRILSLIVALKARAPDLVPSARIADVETRAEAV